MRIGFFGAGNMANALSTSIKTNFPSAEIYIYSPGKINAKILATKISGRSLEDINEMPKDLDWYFLAFKPQNLGDFNFKFHRNSKIISILAGVSLSKLYNKLGNLKIVRMMPNLPTSISSGANLIFLSDSFNKFEHDEVKNFFSTCGNSYFLDSEEQVDIITPFSGSGPALILDFARIFESELGLRGDLGVDTRELIVQIFLGTSLLMKNSSLSFLEMRDQVISKKGVTFEAIKVFEEAGLENIFHRAFDSAYRRTIELSKEG